MIDTYIKTWEYIDKYRDLYYRVLILIKITSFLLAFLNYHVNPESIIGGTFDSDI